MNECSIEVEKVFIREVINKLLHFIGNEKDWCNNISSKKVEKF